MFSRSFENVPLKLKALAATSRLIVFVSMQRGESPWIREYSFSLEVFINSGKQLQIMNRQSKRSNYVIVVMLQMLLVFRSLRRSFYFGSRYSQNS